jgi:bifunctional non-homologous end joining protein LigD
MPVFVVHDHKARSHHFDLRLEMDGVLKSWAIPKRIDTKALHEKKLAVQVEDHEMEYGKFEGKIPQGYGAGEVKIWDKGELEIVDNKPGKIIFRLRGKKLKGDFVLVHFRPKGKEWLFFKKK